MSPLSKTGSGDRGEAVLRCLGRAGSSTSSSDSAWHSTAFADALRATPGVTVLNDVVYTQVCATFGSDERTEEVVRQLLADGTTQMTGSTWHG